MKGEHLRTAVSKLLERFIFPRGGREERVIRDNWQAHNDAEIGRMLGCSTSVAQRRRLSLGLKRPRTKFYYDQGKKCLRPIPNVVWTEDEDNFLKAHYRGYTDKDLGCMLDKSVYHIGVRRRQLDLPKRGGQG